MVPVAEITGDKSLRQKSLHPSQRGVDHGGGGEVFQLLFCD